MGKTQLLAGMSGTACFALIFGGTIRSALAAAAEIGYPVMLKASAGGGGRGIRLVQEQKAAGVQLLATGEMGIGNTTTSSAVAAVLLAQPVQTMTGRGAGLSDAGLARKVEAIRRGIACNAPDPDDVLDVLSKLGGFDIAGLCGMFLGGALAGVPVLMDGFISGVAALCAVRLCPAAAKAVFASHCSTEPAARLVLDALGKSLYASDEANRDGRTWTGHVAEGRVPEGALKLAERESDALPVVTTLVNKWSNNLIARHIFLTLGTLRNAPDEADSGSRTAGGAFAPMERPRPGVDTDDARAVLAGWLAEKGVPDGAVMIDDGSGLSRTSRVTARALTQILAAGWLSPRMTEYAASLPVSGVDGTMRKRLEATGRTHLKTGYLQDVRSIGGYVYAKNGRRYALYASVHGERNMAGGIRFLDKVVEWTYLQK